MADCQNILTDLRSFAVPRAAIDALLKARADAVTIGAYLKLAAHTDASGEYSSASTTAIQNAVGGGKDRFNRQRAANAIATLGNIRPTVDAPKNKRKRGAIDSTNPAHILPSPPLIYTREAWLRERGGELPDGPTERGKIRHVLSAFDESLVDRVWFGGGLVFGDGVDGWFPNPLQQLKNCGDVAARLLLAMYAGQDLDRWFGIPPHQFPWQYYKLSETSHGQFSLLRGRSSSMVAPPDLWNRISNGNSNACFEALKFLLAAGFLYEMVVLLNRNPLPAKFSTGDPYGYIPGDAEILCDLGNTSHFKPVQPEIEQGLGAHYRDTVKALRWEEHPDDYVAIIPTGSPAMIAGLYRLRFRVTNHRNAYVKTAERTRLDANAAALRQLNYIRKANLLDELPRTLQ
ncbi:MAG: hypothetical protein QM706_20605 [Nitrospira sp.]